MGQASAGLKQKGCCGCPSAVGTEVVYHSMTRTQEVEINIERKLEEGRLPSTEISELLAGTLPSLALQNNSGHASQSNTASVDADTDDLLDHFFSQCQGADAEMVANLSSSLFANCGDVDEDETEVTECGLEAACAPRMTVVGPRRSAWGASSSASAARVTLVRRLSTTHVSQMALADKASFLLQTKALVQEDPFPNDDLSRASSLGWRDISKPSANVFWKSRRVEKTVCDSIFMRLRSVEQVPRLPMLSMREDDKIHDGAIPTMWAVEFWNLWFPFCESCEILRRYSPECFIANVKLKVLFLRLDFIALINFEDKLSTEGYMEIVMRSPPTGSEGTQWMGIEVPPRPGILPRVCVKYGLFRAKPVKMDAIEVDAQLEVEDAYAAPGWLKMTILQQLSIRIIPEIHKFQKHFPGSKLDKFFNDEDGVDGKCCDAESLEFIQDLYTSIQNFSEESQ